MSNCNCVELFALDGNFFYENSVRDIALLGVGLVRISSYTS